MGINRTNKTYEESIFVPMANFPLATSLKPEAGFSIKIDKLVRHIANLQIPYYIRMALDSRVRENRIYKVRGYLVYSHTPMF